MHHGAGRRLLGRQRCCLRLIRGQRTDRTPVGIHPVAVSGGGCEGRIQEGSRACRDGCELRRLALGTRAPLNSELGLVGIVLPGQLDARRRERRRYQVARGSGWRYRPSTVPELERSDIRAPSRARCADGVVTPTCTRTCSRRSGPRRACCSRPTGRRCGSASRFLAADRSRRLKACLADRSPAFL